MTITMIIIRFLPFSLIYICFADGIIKDKQLVYSNLHMHMQAVSNV